jgi:hypothetical protein
MREWVTLARSTWLNKNHYKTDPNLDKNKRKKAPPQIGRFPLPFSEASRAPFSTIRRQTTETASCCWVLVAAEALLPLPTPRRWCKKQTQVNPAAPEQCPRQSAQKQKQQNGSLLPLLVEDYSLNPNQIYLLLVQSVCKNQWKWWWKCKFTVNTQLCEACCWERHLFFSQQH